MSMSGIYNDINQLDKACDAIASACFNISQTNDHVAHDALDDLESVLDDLCERLAELRNIRRVVKEVSDANAT